MTATVEKLRSQAFPVLTVAQIAMLRPLGEVRATLAGDIIFDAGQARPLMVVVLRGRTEIVDRTDGDERHISEATPGGFHGEVGLLTGQTVYATCIVREPGEVLILTGDAVQRAISTMPALGDVLVPAFAARRLLLMQVAAPSLTFIGHESSPAGLHLEEFVDRNRIPHRWLEPDDPAATSLLERVGTRGEAAIWVVLRGQKALADPSTHYLAKALGLDLGFGQTEPGDLLVVGTGPAGLSAAVYGASEGLSTIAIDDVAIGGQAGSSSRIENYLGFPTGISGGDLAFLAEIQALKFGARIAVPWRATHLSKTGDVFEIGLNNLKALQARSIIIATGARYRRLGLPTQERFEGAGIYYAATEMEARLCRENQVVVVGGGNSAGQAAMYLADTSCHVQLICRGPNLERGMSQYLVSRLENAPNVRIHANSEIAAVHGDERLASVTIADRSGNQQRLPACALFVMIGADPHTEWLRGTLDLDERGFIVTGAVSGGNGGPPVLSPYQTSLPGVFAVGDVRNGSVKRVASAVGEGSVVVSAVHQYLAAARSA